MKTFRADIHQNEPLGTWENCIRFRMLPKYSVYKTSIVKLFPRNPTSRFPEKSGPARHNLYSQDFNFPQVLFFPANKGLFSVVFAADNGARRETSEEVSGGREVFFKSVFHPWLVGMFSCKLSQCFFFLLFFF